MPSSRLLIATTPRPVSTWRGVCVRCQWLCSPHARWRLPQRLAPPRRSGRKAGLRVQAAATVEAAPQADAKTVDLAVNAIRFLSIDSVNKANSGHPGMPMGVAPLAYVMWNEQMTHNPTNPQWFNRDRFVLSAGHGSMLQYSLMHFSGYASVSVRPCTVCCTCTNALLARPG